MIPPMPYPNEDRAPRTAPEQAPEPVPMSKAPLIPKEQKPPLVFPDAPIPSATDADKAWKEKFDQYASSKKNKKCARMLEKALEGDQFWRIAYAFERRHQDRDPDSVFAYDNKMSLTFTSACAYMSVPWFDGFTLDNAIRDPRISFTARNIIYEGFQPKNEHVVGFNTLMCCDLDTLMTWAGQGAQNVLDTSLLVAICKGEAADIAQLCDMGADINCTHERQNKCDDKYSLHTFGSVYSVEKINEHFSTPLRCAINRGDSKILKQVINLGADISSDFDQLMCQAYKFGNLDIIKILKEAHEAQEKTHGLQPNAPINSTDGWTVLSATFAEYSQPKGATGLQVTYQVDFNIQMVNCVYEKDNAISAPTVIPLCQINNSALLQNAADVIEKSGYTRPDTGHLINHSAGARKITSVKHNAPGR